MNPVDFDSSYLSTEDLIRWLLFVNKSEVTYITISADITISLQNIQCQSLHYDQLILWRLYNFSLCYRLTYEEQLLMKLHLRTMGRHLPYGITLCYLLPDANVRIRLNLSQTGRYLI